MCRLFPYIPIFGRVFSIKKCKKKCVFVINLKNAMLPMKTVFIHVKKGISELGCSLALMHTTYTLAVIKAVSKAKYRIPA